MKLKSLRLFLTTLLTVIASLAFGQAENNDFLRSTGKIYVVVAVLVCTFIGIVALLVYLERRIAKLEKELQDNE